MVPPLFISLVCYVLQVFLNICLTVSFHRWRQYISHRYDFRTKAWHETNDFLIAGIFVVTSPVSTKHRFYENTPRREAQQETLFTMSRKSSWGRTMKCWPFATLEMGPYREPRTERKLCKFRNFVCLFVCFNYVELKYSDKYQVSPQPEVELVIS